MKRTETLFLLGLLLAYFVLATAYAIRTPAWLSPDEPAHYNYAAQVASNGCCPVIEPGDWDQAYLSTLTGVDFAPEYLDRFDTIQYEDHQPPLYYLLGSVVYGLTDGSLTAMRLFSVVIGAGVVIVAFGAARAMLPDRPEIALGTAAVVAFIPQHLHILASVNNDGLAELVIGLTLWALILYIKDESPRVSAWMLGILVGVGLLVKVSTIFMAGLVPLGIVLKWWFERQSGASRIPPLRPIILSVFAFGIPALLLAGVWWIRDFAVYGFPDFLGLAAHNAVVVGQPRTADLIASAGVGEYLRQAAETTFHSFWGKFGWMETVMPQWAYLLIGAILLFALLGWIIAIVTRLRPSSPAPIDAYPSLPPDSPVVSSAPASSVASNLSVATGVSSSPSPIAASALPLATAIPSSQPLTPASDSSVATGVSSSPSPIPATALPLATAIPSSQPLTPASDSSVVTGISSSPSPIAASDSSVAPSVSSSPSPSAALNLLVATGVFWSQPLTWALLLLMAVLAVAQFIYYNTEFQQFQGRYMYPGLIPFGLWLILGISALWRLAARDRLKFLPSAALAFTLISLNAYTLWRVIPSLAS